MAAAATDLRSVIEQYPEIEKLRKRFFDGQQIILDFYRDIKNLNKKIVIPGAGGDEQEAITEKYLIKESKLDELLKDIRGWKIKFEVDLYKYIDDLEAKRIASYSSPTHDTAPLPVWQDDEDEVPVGAGYRKLSRRNKKQKKSNKSRKSHK